MLLEEVLRIIDSEKLSDYNIFENRLNRENEMVIVKNKNEWIVYATDERACKITGSEKIFDTEESALDNFVKRLRALNIMKTV